LIWYFDASALARRYVREAGSASIRRQLRRGGIATSRLSAIEVASALARRAREGAFTAADRDRALRALNADLAAWILVELTAELTAEAQTLLVRHRLRSGDAVQLASCLHLQRETGERIPFAAFDDRLTTAARAEGLTLGSFS
jgi:predicted nucleic acid-binding protein